MSTRQKYERTKPHVNIGTMGHVDHGKTTLTAAITKVLADRGSGTFVPLAKIDRSPEEAERGITIQIGHVEYETATRHYAHVDMPGHADYVKNMVTGASQVDGAILVVSADDGVMQQSREHLILARQLGVQHLVVALNKADGAHPDILELVELEVRELLDHLGFDAVGTPVVRVSGLRALEGVPEWVGSVDSLLEALDTWIPVPVRQLDGPFLMSVENVLTISGRGTVVTGAIERGTVSIGDTVEVVGLTAPIRAVVTGVQTFGKDMDRGEAGDNAALLLRGVRREQVVRGQVLATPGSVGTATRVQARVTLLTKAEGARHTPVVSGYRPQLYLRTTDVVGDLELVGVDLAQPGDTVDTVVVLGKPVPVEVGQTFAVREGGRTVASGTVTAVLE